MKRLYKYQTVHINFLAKIFITLYVSTMVKEHGMKEISVYTINSAVEERTVNKFLG